VIMLMHMQGTVRKMVYVTFSIRIKGLREISFLKFLRGKGSENRTKCNCPRVGPSDRLSL
jgi:hypothetical protein